MMLLPAPTTVAWTFFFFVSSDFEFHSELTLLPFNYLNYAEFWPFEEDLIFFENHLKSYLVNEMTSSSLEKHSSVMISLLKFLLWQRREYRSRSNLLFANSPRSLVSTARMHRVWATYEDPQESSAANNSSAKDSLIYLICSCLRGSSCLCLLNCSEVKDN